MGIVEWKPLFIFVATMLIIELFTRQETVTLDFLFSYSRKGVES